MIREFEFHLSLSAYISNGIFVLINTVYSIFELHRPVSVSEIVV